MRGFQYPLQNNIKLPPGSKDLVALTLLSENLTSFAHEWDSVSGLVDALVVSDDPAAPAAPVAAYDT